MTTVRKRKMNRLKVKKLLRRTKDRFRQVSFQANPVIAANWDDSLTLKQNYKKLGLRMKLGGHAGGEEKEIETWRERKERLAEEDARKIKPEDIAHTEDPAQIPEGEARIIRDDEGKVVKVIQGTMKPKPVEPKAATPLIQTLEEMAQKNASRERDHHQTARETDIMRMLYEKHGDDYEAMKWDKHLNLFALLPGVLRKKMKLWKKKHNIE